MPARAIFHSKFLNSGRTMTAHTGHTAFCDCSRLCDSRCRQRENAKGASVSSAIEAAREGGRILRRFDMKKYFAFAQDLKLGRAGHQPQTADARLARPPKRPITPRIVHVILPLSLLQTNTPRMHRPAEVRDAASRTRGMRAAKSNQDVKICEMRAVITYAPRRMTCTGSPKQTCQPAIYWLLNQVAKFQLSCIQVSSNRLQLQSQLKFKYVFKAHRACPGSAYVMALVHVAVGTWQMAHAHSVDTLFILAVRPI